MGYAQDQPALIIISGLPRSGTTWLGKLFDSHPRTLYRHEPDSVAQIYRWLPLIVEGDHGQYKAHLLDFVRRLPEMRHSKVSASLPVFAKAFWRPAQRCLVRPSHRVVKALSSLGRDVELPRYCLPKSEQDYVVVWKTIESSGRLGLYAEVLQNKRIIQIVRHPCGVIASQLRGQRLNKFGGELLAEDYGIFQIALETSIGRRYGLALHHIKAMEPVERLAWLCMVNMERIMGHLQGRSDCRIVGYEDLCERPLETIQELFDFCTLDFGRQTSKFLMHSTTKAQASYFSVIKDPLDSAYKWKKELSGREQKLVFKQLERSPMAQTWFG